MPKTILIHSFRHGVGRSSLAANMAYLLANQGQRVTLIETNTKLPVAHILFGLPEEKLRYSFNDYLLGNCEIHQAAHDLTPHLSPPPTGRLFLIPGNTGNPQNICELHNAQDVYLLNTGCQNLTASLNLDAVLIDTQPGIKENALVAITVSDTLVIILRMDQRDYQGTSVTMDVVRQLDVPRIVLIVNEAPTVFNFAEIKATMEQTYQCEVLAVLPHVDEMMALANKDIFALRYPRHAFTLMLNEVAANLLTAV